MKKLILPIIIFMMFIPFYVNAETCNTDKISISSITVESKSDNTEEIEEASASGKNINLNLSMSEVGDDIEYKIIVKNNSNEDYELDKNSINISSDYIDYTLKLNDNSNIVKANSSKTVYLKVEYKNEVPEEAFESGTYSDNKTMTVNLSTSDKINDLDTLKNPNTGVQSYIIILTLILIISITVCVILRKKKNAKLIVLLIGTVIIIPASVYAICKCEMKVESNVIIKSQKHNIYVINDYGWNTKEYLDNNYVSYDAFENRYFVMNDEIYIYYQNGVLNIGQYKEGKVVSTGEIPLGKWCMEGDYQNTHHCSNLQNTSLSSSFYCDRKDYCTASDYEELNFSNYFIDWRGDWYPKFPTEFTMPNHDVYFVINDG